MLAGAGSAAWAAGDTPAWLKARIAKYEKAAFERVPHEVWTYAVGGKPVYLLRGGQPSVLLDARGRVICHPDGQGKAAKACAAAYAPPNQMTAVWQDPRLGLTVKPKPDNTK